MTTPPSTNQCLVCGGRQRRAFAKGPWWYCRCERCGLVSQSPLPGAELIAEHYRRGFSDGNYRLLQDFAAQYLTIYQGYARRLGEHLDLDAKPRILDVGCFTGDFLCLLRDAGADVYGLELQPEAAAIASARLPGRVFTARVEGTEFPQLAYDAVTLMAVIEHLVDPVALLERCCALLKPGGLLMIQTPNSGSAAARAAGRYWPLYAPVEHLHLFSARSLRELLPRLGLVDLRIGPHVKRLPITYVYEMMRSYGPELRRLATPLYRALPGFVRCRSLFFYGGEMIATAMKPRT